MRLVYCIAGTRHSGGMERVLANKANYWVRHGHDVTIVTTDQHGELPFFHLDTRVKCIDLEVNYEDNNGKSVWNKLVYYPYKQYVHRKRLQSILKREQPDITISMFCNEAAFLPNIKEGGLKVLEIHFSKYKRLQYGRKGLWRWVDIVRSRYDEILVKKYDRFVVLTEEDKSYWGALPNMVVIPNARTFTPTNTSLLQNKIVLAVGRLTYQKGFERLIEAWSLLNDKFPDWKLVIVGDGEKKEELEQLVVDSCLQDSVFLKAPVKDMEQLYREASVIAMTSRYEGLPMILLEAQAYGIPIVSFKCQCGPADIITDGQDGFLVPEGDIPMMAEKLSMLMSDNQLRAKMGKAAVLSSKRFDEERVMNQWENLFRSLLNKI